MLLVTRCLRIFALLLVGLLSLGAIGQIPKHPNFKDAAGKKQGLWSTSLDDNFKETKGKASYFRIINYHDDSPDPLIKDYNLKGELVVESRLQARFVVATIYQGTARSIGTVRVSRDKPMQVSYEADLLSIDSWSTIYQKAIKMLTEENDTERGRGYFDASLFLLNEEFTVHPELLHSADTLKLYRQIIEQARDLNFKFKDYEQVVATQIELLRVIAFLGGTETKEYLNELYKLGFAYENVDMTKADSVYDRVWTRAIPVFGKGSTEHLDFLSLYAKFCVRRGEIAKAEQLYLAFNTATAEFSGPNVKRRVTALTELGGLYASLNRMADAGKTYEEAVAVAKKNLDLKDEDYIISVSRLGGHFVMTERYRDAIPLLKEALRFSSAEDNVAMFFLANAYQGDHQLERAETIHKRRVEQLATIRPYGSFHLQALHDQAFFYKKTGRPYLAITILKKVLQEGAKRPEDLDKVIVTVIGDLSDCYSATGDYQGAIDARQLKYDLATEAGDTLSSLSLWSENADDYLKLGNFAAAEFSARRALDSAKSRLRTNDPELNTYRTNLALIYEYLARYPEAIALLQETLELDSSTPIDKIVAHLAIANILIEEQKYSEAEASLLRAKSTSGVSALVASEFQALIENGLGTLYLRTERLNEAEKSLLAALTLYESFTGKESIGYGNVLFMLSQVYHKLGNFKKSEELLKREDVILNKLLGAQHMSVAFCKKAMAVSDETTGNRIEALQHYKESANGLIDIMETNSQKGAATFSEKEKMSFLENALKCIAIFHSFAIRNNNTIPEVTSEMYNHRLTTKSYFFRTSRGMEQWVAKSKNDTVRSLYASWKVMREQLSHAYQMTEEEKKSADIDEKALEVQVNNREKILKGLSARFEEAFDHPKYTWQDIQKTLKANECAIEVIRIPLYDTRHLKWTDTVVYAALIVKPTTKDHPDLVILNNGNELEGRLAKNYRNSIKTRQTDTLSYDAFWRSIMEKIGSSTTVYFSPDGVYNHISLGSLQDNKTGAFLLESLDIRYVSTTRDLLQKSPASKKPDKVTLLGFPDYSMTDAGGESGPSPAVLEANAIRAFSGGNINDLPGTGREIDAISSFCKGNRLEVASYTRQHATEEQIKKLASPPILHIATHGFFLEDIQTLENGFIGINQEKLKANPLFRSGLLLAGCKTALNGGRVANSKEDGVLTAFEVMDLDLSNTDLVILSACETGLGELKNGEGVFGLQRAFQSAGAKSLIMSLWKVDDEATQELMKLFYQALLPDSGKAQALKAAQQILQKKYKHPYYWAGFILVGK